ncbi:MAG: trypsin-like peptidase domain-containing protein [Victivallales bacterium]|nr:trypsin-like peptidase domain-containing protein [Victivallales bacterium]
MKTMGMCIWVATLMAWTLLAADGNNLTSTNGIDPLNAVVKINTEAYVPNYFIPWLDHGQNGASGSGVVIRGNQILTNAHNLVYATYITISKQSSDDIYEVKVKAIDHDCDLALLEVNDSSFFSDITPFDIGETPPPQTQVSVAGFPIGGDGLSITQGIISRIEIQPYVHSWNYLLAAQLDAAVNPGNSGGPVISNGKVVGIAFQGNDNGEGLGYMIPSEIIRHFLRDIEDGKVDGFGMIGFGYTSLENEDAREYLKMKKGQTGVRIARVLKVNKDLLHLDDVLLAVDGVPVANNGNIRTKTGEARSFVTLVHQKQIGEKVKLTILRSGKEILVELPVRKIEYQCHGYLYDQLPDFYITGGFVFTSLSYSFLEEWGKRNPPEELNRKMFQEKDTDDQEVIVLSTVLADRFNRGYQNFRSQILTKVNEKAVRNLKELISIVENDKGEYITFYFGEKTTPVTLNRKKMLKQTPVILKRYRVPSDRSKSLQ